MQSPSFRGLSIESAFQVDQAAALSGTFSLPAGRAGETHESSELRGLNRGLARRSSRLDRFGHVSVARNCQELWIGVSWADHRR
jgi:hypothetical protein